MLTAAENLRQVLHGEWPERIPIDYHEDGRYGEDAYIFLTHRGASAPEQGGDDLWGVSWAATQVSLLFPIRHPIRTLEEALSMPFPDINDPSLWETARAQADGARGHKVLIGFLICTLWERLKSLVGTETALIGLAKEPDIVSAVLERITNWQIACAGRFMELGIEAVRITDDYGTQRDLMMSPLCWRRVILPQLARLVNHYQSAGVPVLLHSCGNLSRIMDELIDLGFVAFNIQTNANDLAALRMKYGRRFTIWGGMSTQLLTDGTPDQIREAVRWAVETLGRDGGLILAPDQYIPAPQDNLAAFYQTAHELQTLPLPRQALNQPVCTQRSIHQ